MQHFAKNHHFICKNKKHCVIISNLDLVRFFDFNNIKYQKYQDSSIIRRIYYARVKIECWTADSFKDRVIRPARITFSVTQCRPFVSVKQWRVDVITGDESVVTSRPRSGRGPSTPSSSSSSSSSTPDAGATLKSIQAPRSDNRPLTQWTSKLNEY